MAISAALITTGVGMAGRWSVTREGSVLVPCSVWGRAHGMDRGGNGCGVRGALWAGVVEVGEEGGALSGHSAPVDRVWAWRGVEDDVLWCKAPAGTKAVEASVRRCVI